MYLALEFTNIILLVIGPNITKVMNQLNWLFVVAEEGKM